MKVPLYSNACCPIVDEIKTDVHCLMNGLCCELTKLEHKHKNAFLNRPRLHELAVPLMRKRAERFVPTCACKFPKPVDIIHMEKEERTRTTQLAYPQVRKLLLSQKQLNKIWENPFRNYILNRLIRNSLLSLYSRLANVQPPKEPVPIHKWDKNEWKVHRKYLKGLAKHKVPPPQPKIIRKRMPLSSMFRYKKLAIPKMIVPKYIPEVFSVYPKPKPKPQYQPPKRKIISFDDDDDKKGKKNKGIKMGKPKPKGGRAGGGAERLFFREPFKVASRALTAIPTDRIVQLSQPRKRIENKECAPIPTRPKTLSTKITSRLILLATPRRKRKLKKSKNTKQSRVSYIRADRLKAVEKPKRKKNKKNIAVKKDEPLEQKFQEEDKVEPQLSSQSVSISQSEAGFWNNAVYEPRPLKFKLTAG